jgi:EAL domain-containing protein (putative c-di-GMP-specific phosphodiesterase class I)
MEIAIDDFGTGYCSLSYLQRFPIDVVKLDYTFLRDITTKTSDAAIATTVITMAHSLKLRVIAEGVETEEQLAFLRQRGCDEMQGYLFSKPADAAHVEKVLEKSIHRQKTVPALESR